MPLTSKTVDTAIIMTIGPLVDAADPSTRETAVAFNAPGIDVDLIQETENGTTVTAVTPTSGGDNDWTHIALAEYQLEITAAQNDEECVAYFAFAATGVFPAKSNSYEIIDVVNSDALDAWLSLIERGTAQDGAATTITLAASSAFADNALKGWIIAITGGTGAGQVRWVASNVGATDVVTVHRAWGTNPDNTSIYLLYPSTEPSAFLEDSAITAAKIGADAITADKIADDAISADQLADDAITADKIAADAIGEDQVSAAAVTKIADGEWEGLGIVVDDDAGTVAITRGGVAVVTLTATFEERLALASVAAP